MTDADIIAIRKATRAADVTNPFADSIAFARAILQAREPWAGVANFSGTHSQTLPLPTARPAAQKVRWTHAPIPPSQWGEWIRAHPLYKIGDTILVWANEGDLYREGERVDVAP
jgi:hypothetical protein